MAYIEPLVMVFQEYSTLTTSTQTASLPACVIGPCYHIIDATEDETLALFGQYTSQGITGGQFPSNEPGAVISADSVVFRFKNLKVRMSSEAITPDSRNLNVLQLAADTFPASIELGDALMFDGVDTEFRVIDIDADAYTIMVNRTAPATGAFNIIRTMEEILLPGTAEGVMLDLSSEKFSIFGVTVNGNLVESAELYVGYKALRQDLSSVGTVYSVDEIVAQCGKISPENPLAYGLSVALANTTTGVYYVGVDSDDLEGYTSAKDRIESYSPLYSIVALTTQPGVLSMFKNHAEQMSEPEEGQWRIALGCSELPTVEVRAESAEGASIEITPDGDGDLVVLTDPEAVFMSSSVDAGDILEITAADGTVYKYTVSGVASDDILTITQDTPFAEDLVINAPASYRVLHAMSKNDQANAIAATSRSYGSRRFVHVWPDVCLIDGVEQPGYYLCCAVAGAISGLQPHYGMTRLSLSGIDGVKHSGDYFNRDQLNIIADGGTFIFLQSSPTAVPHIRHQLTTDRSAIEFQEVSFVKNFDYVAYLCKDTMDEYIGKWNITDETCGAIRTALSGLLETLRLQVSPKIGAPIISYNITKVERLADVRDRIEAYVDVEFAYPLNTIGLHIVSA